MQCKRLRLWRQERANSAPILSSVAVHSKRIAVHHIMELMMTHSPENVRQYGATNQWQPLDPEESLQDVGADEEPGKKRPPAANLA